MSLVCDMVSYDLVWSTFSANVGCLIVVSVCTLFRIVCRAVVVLEFGLNAYCVGDMMLCWVRFMSCVFMIESSTFAIMAVISVYSFWA